MLRDKFVQHVPVDVVDVETGTLLVGHPPKRTAAIGIGDGRPVALDAVPVARLGKRGTDAAVPVQHRAAGVEGQRFDSARHCCVHPRRGLLQSAQHVQRLLRLRPPCVVRSRPRPPPRCRRARITMRAGIDSRQLSSPLNVAAGRYRSPCKPRSGRPAGGTRGHRPHRPCCRVGQDRERQLVPFGARAW